MWYSCRIRSNTLQQKVTATPLRSFAYFLYNSNNPRSPNIHHIHSLFVPLVIALSHSSHVVPFLWTLSEKKALFLATLVLTTYPSSISFSSSAPDHHTAILSFFILLVRMFVYSDQLFLTFLFPRRHCNTISLHFPVLVHNNLHSLLAFSLPHIRLDSSMLLLSPLFRVFSFPRSLQYVSMPLRPLSCIENEAS